VAAADSTKPVISCKCRLTGVIHADFRISLRSLWT
jgi:hypothetical protein